MISCMLLVFLLSVRRLPYVGSASVSPHIKPDLVLKQPWRQATLPAVSRDRSDSRLRCKPLRSLTDRQDRLLDQVAAPYLLSLSAKTSLVSPRLFLITFSLCFLLTKLWLSFFLSLSNRRLQALPPDLRPPPVTRSPRPRFLSFDHFPLLTFLFSIFPLFFDPDTIISQAEDGYKVA